MSSAQAPGGQAPSLLLSQISTLLLFGAQRQSPAPGFQPQLCWKGRPFSAQLPSPWSQEKPGPSSPLVSPCCKPAASSGHISSPPVRRGPSRGLTIPASMSAVSPAAHRGDTAVPGIRGCRPLFLQPWASGCLNHTETKEQQF